MTQATIAIPCRFNSPDGGVIASSLVRCRLAFSPNIYAPWSLNIERLSFVPFTPVGAEGTFQTFDHAPSELACRL
ncbi:hypothetical protein EMEDMD4_650032 [Sinorhizobium medicae]|uniref:Uncharacterized protein n=1 Tax=Sinorhizobium medicae TaxID=110321 RepID=A0A508X573_9HYPH|nr:hypothetical protein EMEDMD4_650032 [Sinorhizobium medicae]